jgi:3-oxoacyl-[acyl-carrier-protein] synthase III
VSDWRLSCQRDLNCLPAGLLAFNFGCSGFLKLLHEAVIHLVGDDNLSRIALLNIETPETWHDSSDRLFCGIVAAGATAMVSGTGAGHPGLDRAFGRFSDP